MVARAKAIKLCARSFLDNHPKKKKNEFHHTPIFLYFIFVLEQEREEINSNITAKVRGCKSVHLLVYTGVANVYARNLMYRGRKTRINLMSFVVRKAEHVLHDTH